MQNVCKTLEKSRRRVSKSSQWLGCWLIRVPVSDELVRLFWAGHSFPETSNSSHGRAADRLYSWTSV